MLMQPNLNNWDQNFNFNFNFWVTYFEASKHSSIFLIYRIELITILFYVFFMTLSKANFTFIKKMKIYFIILKQINTFSFWDLTNLKDSCSAINWNSFLNENVLSYYSWELSSYHHLMPIYLAKLKLLEFRLIVDKIIMHIHKYQYEICEIL